MMNKRVFVFAVACCCVSLVHAANITFADSKVKALCVQHWDSNKDGELSTDEAAAVKSLGSVFRGNNTITSFEELRHFTGLTAIDDYAFYQSSLQKVAFPESVTSIGECAFCQSSLSGELRVPGTVKYLERHAFNLCKQLTGVILEEGVETVGWHCFSGPIRTLSLPSTLTYMSSMAIDPYESAGSSSSMVLPEGVLYVYEHGSTPAVIDDFAFFYVFADAYIVVPFGAVEGYKAVEGWSHFREYLEYGDVNADGLIDDEDADLLNDYLAGEDVTLKNVYLADINWDGRVDDDDLTALQDILDGHEGIITGVQAVDAQRTPVSSSSVYSLDGRMVAQDDSALDALPKGVYIYRGRKIVLGK